MFAVSELASRLGPHHSQADALDIPGGAGNYAISLFVVGIRGSPLMLQAAPTCMAITHVSARVDCPDFDRGQGRTEKLCSPLTVVMHTNAGLGTDPSPGRTERCTSLLAPPFRCLPYALGHLVMHSVMKLRRAGPRRPLSLALLQQAACFSGFLTRQHWLEFCPWPQGPRSRPGLPGPQPCATVASGVAARMAAAKVIAGMRRI